MHTIKYLVAMLMLMVITDYMLGKLDGMGKFLVSMSIGSLMNNYKNIYF